MYFTYYKENNIRNIFRVLIFYQFLANKHQRLRDSKSGRAELWHWSPTKQKNKQRAKQEPRSRAHGRAVKIHNREGGLDTWS